MSVKVEKEYVLDLGEDWGQVRLSFSTDDGNLLIKQDADSIIVPIGEAQSFSNVLDNFVRMEKP